MSSNLRRTWRGYRLWDQRHYKRSESTAYPRKFSNPLQTSEYIKTGHIRETLDIQHSPYYQALVTFSAIYGIGPTTARHLYQIGLRTLDDLKDYYERKTTGNPNDSFAEGMINSILLREDFAKKQVQAIVPSSRSDT
jgi:DNA polymerase/3'-5' exonuclease PolX